MHGQRSALGIMIAGMPSCKCNSEEYIEQELASDAYREQTGCQKDCGESYINRICLATCSATIWWANTRDLDARGLLHQRGLPSASRRCTSCKLEQSLLCTVTVLIVRPPQAVLALPFLPIYPGIYWDAWATALK